jgi:hypothetical protein
LNTALAAVAGQFQPFDMRTVGVLAFTGRQASIAIAPYKDEQLTKFHAAVWETSTPFANGRVDPFYEPGRWVPHVTLKRCGENDQSFGRAMQRLTHEGFAGTIPLEAIGVQHDPGKNSLTHYMRLRFPLGRSTDRVDQIQTNATITNIVQITADDPSRLLTIRTGDGREIKTVWTASDIVRETATAQSSLVHFSNARCRVEGDRIVAVVPNTPFPVR